MASTDRRQLSTTAFVGIGSNIQPRSKYIERSLNAINANRKIDVVQVSTIYETRPQGGPQGQMDYLNAVAKIVTSLDPLELLEALQNIELDLGRKRDVAWGPRTIDLDLLLYNDQIISTERLMVPHPLMHERRFVMQGLAEIAPDVVHPILQMTATTILESMGDQE